MIDNDADEFWWPFDGDLKDVFSRLAPDVNVVEAPRHNFVTVADSGEPFWRHMLYRDAISVNSRGKRLLPKVAHRGSPTVKVNQGNHSVENAGSPRAARDLVEILHFPTRSYGQIENKIAKGGAAYERNHGIYRRARWRLPGEIAEESRSTWPPAPLFRADLVRCGSARRGAPFKGCRSRPKAGRVPARALRSLERRSMNPRIEADFHERGACVAARRHVRNTGIQQRALSRTVLGERRCAITR